MALTPRLILPLALALSVAGCVAIDDGAPDFGAVQSPLIGGALDQEDPSVVALVFGNNFVTCTGTLVSPTVVLTAAHCIDDLGTDPSVSIFFGADINQGGTRVSVKARQNRPGWNGNIGQNDIGVLLLSFPRDPSEVIAMNRVPLDNSYVDTPYRHVGFGTFDFEGSSPIADGRKRQGTTKILGVSGDIISSGDENIKVCYGDSGGPAFINLGDGEAIAGVHSYTSTNNNVCIAPAGDTRVDKHLDDFILPYIQKNDPTCQQDGICADASCTDDPDCANCGSDGICVVCAEPDVDCPNKAIGETCRQNAECSEGSCVVWAGDQTSKFCSKNCTVDGTCPDGMKCENNLALGNICNFSDTPPGGLGESCAANTDCSTGICDQGTCVVRCNLGIGLGCPLDFECSSLNSVDYFCNPLPDEGGCAVSHQSDRGPLAPLFIAGLLLLALGRRRRAAD